MELKTLKQTLIGLTLLLLLLLFYPICPLVVKHQEVESFIVFLGIGQILTIAAIIAISLIGIIKQYELAAKQKEIEKAEIEAKHRKESLEQQIAAAEQRRQTELERNRVNDLFRLIELAKDKMEEITDKTKTKEKGDVKTSENNIITTKNDKVDKELLTVFMSHYSKAFAHQQTVFTDNQPDKHENETTPQVGTP
jgi:hypothetical protein